MNETIREIKKMKKKKKKQLIDMLPKTSVFSLNLKHNFERKNKNIYEYNVNTSKMEMYRARETKMVVKLTIRF